MESDAGGPVLRRKRRRKKGPNYEDELKGNTSNNRTTTTIATTTILPMSNNNDNQATTTISHNRNHNHKQQQQSLPLLWTMNSRKRTNHIIIFYYFTLSILLLLISPPFTTIVDKQQQQQHHQQLTAYDDTKTYYQRFVHYFFTTCTTNTTSTRLQQSYRLSRVSNFQVEATFNFIQQNQQQPPLSLSSQQSNRDANNNSNNNQQQQSSSSYDQYNNQDSPSITSISSEQSADTQISYHQYPPINSPYFSAPLESGSGMSPKSYQSTLYSASHPSYSSSSSSLDSLITAKCLNSDQDDIDCKLSHAYNNNNNNNEDSIITPIVIFESSSSSSSSSSSLSPYDDDQNSIASPSSSSTILPLSSSSRSSSGVEQDPFDIRTSFVATPRPATHTSKHKTTSISSNSSSGGVAGHQCKDDDDDCDDDEDQSSSEDDDKDSGDDDDNDNEDTNSNQDSSEGSGDNEGDNENDYGDDDENGDQDYGDQSSGDLDQSSVTPTLAQNQQPSSTIGGNQQSAPTIRDGTYPISSTTSNNGDNDSINQQQTTMATNGQHHHSTPEQKAEIQVIIHSTMEPRLAIATTPIPPPRSVTTIYSGKNRKTHTTTTSSGEATYDNQSTRSSSDIGDKNSLGGSQELDNSKPRTVPFQNVHRHHQDFGSGHGPSFDSTQISSNKKSNEIQDTSFNRINEQNQDDDKPFVSHPILPPITQQNQDGGDNSQITGSSRQDSITSEAPQILATFKPVPMPANAINTYLNRYYENQATSSQGDSSQLDRFSSISGSSMGGMGSSSSKASQSRIQSISSRVVPAPINQQHGDKSKQPYPYFILLITFGIVFMMALVVISLLGYSLYCRPKSGPRPGLGAAQMVANANFPNQNTFGSFNKLVSQPPSKNQPVNYYPANMIVNTKGRSATKTSITKSGGQAKAPASKRQYSGDGSFSTSYESSRSMDNINSNAHYRRDGNYQQQQYNTMRPQREAPPLAPKPQLQVRHQVDSAGRVYNDYSQQGVLINGLMPNNNKNNGIIGGKKSSEWYV